ncbi:MAG: hypothetical protein JRN06_08120 [Nitrososphaerota archaeon]|nr:hypothetical protein [Nitrososphaerota archaeon]MDG7024252.1 hypothetical protein [Nitrososphaerota archaeon]
MNATAELELAMDGAGSVRKLSAVLAPDNEGLPRGLRLTMAGAGRSLRCRVESDSPSAAISTTLALMRDIALFQEVWLLSRTRRA